MDFKAHLSFVRIAPRKMGEVASQVRGKPINEALQALQFSPRKKIAGKVFQLLKSAAANADQKGTVDVDNLYVKTIMVNQGPTLKRWRPRGKGSASGILKRTSHVSVVLAEK